MTVTMIDCTSLNQAAVLRQFGPGQPVAGYSTGPPEIQWTHTMFGQFLEKIRIAQSADLAEDDLSEARCLDVENFAATPADWPDWWRSRTNKEAATPYCSLFTVPQILAACRAEGIPDPSRWWLAWWPQFPVRPTAAMVLSILKQLTGVVLPEEDVWAWQYANHALWDVSAVFGTPDFSRR